ncbi:MAG: hypothetical protein OSA98_16490 [Rubripirellula sp.]|nr:hypothetical protein [Rubripirellula sp.]
MQKMLKSVVLGVALMCGPVVNAQITTPRILSAGSNRSANLEEQLVNRLRATRDDQRAYIKHVVGLTKNGKLETKLVVAVERYAIRRNSHYPFPFFERALKYEAAKRGTALPTVRNFASTRISGPANGGILP